MKSWSIGKRVSVTCGVLLILMLVAGVVGTLGIQKGTSNVKHMMSDCVDSLEILSHLKGAVGELRGDAMASLVPELEVVRAKNIAGVGQLQTTIPEILNSYEKTIVNDEDRSLFNKEKAAMVPYLALCGRVASLAEAGKLDEAARIYGAQGRAEYVALDAIITEHVAFNTKYGESLYQEALAAGQLSMVITWLVIAIAFIGGLGLAIVVVRGMSKALKQCAEDINVSSQQIVSASSQLTASSEALAQGASEQAASLEETSSSSHEIGALTVKNAAHAQRAVGLMHAVDNHVSEANAALTEMSSSMDRIANSSGEIARIIKVIDAIAFQTNILALNAAVEAARAGEAGMGFAVVAEEVRSLAQRCAQAAKDTTELIAASVSNANSGTEKVSRVRVVIDSVTSSASEVKTLIEELNGAAGEQSRGVEQISSALQQMEQVTQRTAANSEESAAASQQLKAQAESMREVISSLAVLATGKAK